MRYVSRRPFWQLWLPWTGVILLLCLMPVTLHLTFTVSGQKVAMAEKASILARHVEGLIAARPLSWEFATHRLDYVLSFRGDTAFERVRIFAIDGSVLSAEGDPGPGPVLVISEPLHDGGSVVGRLEIARGLADYLPEFGGTMVLSLFLGGIVYMVALRAPLRTVTDLAHRLSSERDAETVRRQIVEDQLVHARKLEAIATLASGMAHSLNNMLTPVTMLGETLRAKAPAGSSDRELLDRICESTARASGLVASVLAFGRRGKLETHPVRVQDLVGNATEIFRRSLTAPIRLIVDMSGDVGWVAVDVAQTEATLINLMDNSRDALGELGGSVTVTARVVDLEAMASSRTPELAPGRFIVVSVADDGPGMPPEVAHRAFEPFFSTKAVGKGTGLGLFSAYGIVRGQGGTIVLDTREGKGTTASVFLPACPPPSDGDHSPESHLYGYDNREGGHGSEHLDLDREQSR